MKNIVLALSLSISTSLFAAEPACSLDFSKVHSLLDQKSKDFKFIRPEKKETEKKTVTQIARLKIGEQVLHETGGCAHFTFSFTYSRLSQTKMIDINQEIQYALKLLVNTPVIGTYKDFLVKSLENAGKRERDPSGVYPLVCGDSQCELNLSEPKKIKLSFSQPL